MAGFNSDSQSGGIYLQIQEIIAKYIGSLEKSKIDEGRLAMQLAEEAKLNQQKFEEAAKNIGVEIDALVEKKAKLVSDIANVEASKGAKKLELAQLAEVVVEKQKELSAVLSEKESVGLEIVKKKEEVGALVARKNEFNDLAAKTSEKLLQLKEFESKLKQLKSQEEESNSKVESNKILVKDSVERNKVLLLDKAVLELEKTKAAEKLVVAQVEVEQFFAENRAKKAAATKDLEAVLLELKSVKEKYLSERQMVESETLFIKQMNDLNVQKNKTLAFTKDKLKDIISELVLNDSESKSAELKNLLLIVEKL